MLRPLDVSRMEDFPPAQPGRYQFDAEIARGGMGVVHRVRDRTLGRAVALKALHEDHLRNPELVRRFFDEARIAASLEHPGLVPVYDAGLLPDGRPYFTMRLIEGRGLDDILREPRDRCWDLRCLLLVVEQVCRTVAYAHWRGVIHRDLKPANVMVGRFGEVLVMDWGLARVGPASAAAPRGPVAGTLAYMPPEQARGEEVGPGADVFGLGGILYEVLMGEPPFSTLRTAAHLLNHDRDLTEALSRLDRSAADPELIALTRACLAELPEERPAGAAEVAAGLNRHLHGRRGD